MRWAIGMSLIGALLFLSPLAWEARFPEKMQLHLEAMNMSASISAGHPRLPACRMACLPSTSFCPDSRLLKLRGTTRGRSNRTGTVQPIAFKFLKQLGLQKPNFLPDFGLEKRKALLDRLYTSFDRPTLNDTVADDFTLQERKAGSKAFSKRDWIDLVVDRVIPSVPDFNWTHATDGSKDKEGYVVVRIQATGHHTGKPFTLGYGLPEVEPSGKKFLLAEETQMVLVEDGKVQRIEVLPTQGAGPQALYDALAGKKS